MSILYFQMFKNMQFMNPEDQTNIKLHNGVVRGDTVQPQQPLKARYSTKLNHMRKGEVLRKHCLHGKIQEAASVCKNHTIRVFHYLL